MGQGVNTQQPVLHAICRKISYSEQPSSASTAWTVPIGTIPKGSFKTATKAVVVTAFAGASAPLLKVGVSGQAEMFMVSNELPLLTVGNTLTGGTTGFGEITSDAPVIATLASGGTTLTAGVARVLIEFFPPVMNKEAETLFDSNN